VALLCVLAYRRLNDAALSFHADSIHCYLFVYRDSIWAHLIRFITLQMNSLLKKTRYVCSVPYVCLSVCLSAFESLNIWSSFSRIPYISRKYMVEVRTWKPKSRLQKQKGRKSVFLQWKTSIGNNSGSMKNEAMKFARSMGFSAMADRVVWSPSLSRDRKWPSVTKCTHPHDIGIRLEGIFVTTTVSSTQRSTTGECLSPAQKRGTWNTFFQLHFVLSPRQLKTFLCRSGFDDH